MTSIRTTLVVAGFVAMGLTSAAEHIVGTARANNATFETVKTASVMRSGDGLAGAVQRLSGKAARLAASLGLVPRL